MLTLYRPSAACAPVNSEMEMMSKTMKHNGNSDSGTKKPDWAALAADLLNTPEVRRGLTQVGAAWLAAWSGSHPLKRAVGRPAAWGLAKTLKAGKADDLATVFSNPAHIEALLQLVPELFEPMAAVARAAARAVAQLPTGHKKALLERPFSSRPSDSDVALLTEVARIVEDLYREDPHFFSSLLLPLIEAYFARADFGELKSILDAAGEDIAHLLKQCAGLMLEYPAKLISLLALVPDGVNIGLLFLESILAGVNDLPPDILTDLLLTLLGQVDEAAVGRGISRINEVIRQLHTGSTLIGEMDAPRFSADLRAKIQAVVAEIDPALAMKARSALIDGRETLIRHLIDTAGDHPDYLNLWLQQLTLKRNADIRILRHKLQTFENLPEEEALSALSAGLSNWNAYDLAEMVNAVGRTLNRIHHVTPDLFPALVSEFVNSLDLYELEETLDNYSGDLAEVIRPLFRVAAPPIIREVCRFFEPGEEDDGCDAAMEAARVSLRQWLLKEEKM